MQLSLSRLRKFEFEWRIAISFTIVLGVCAAALLFYPHSSPTFVIVGSILGISPPTALKLGFCSMSIVMLLVSLLRMWAGSVLTPHRVMAFKVQRDALKTSGPYRLVRNPIYLADLIALSAFALCLPPIGLAMPVLFAVHYRGLILFEEDALRTMHGENFDVYESRAPRMIPSLRSIGQWHQAIQEFQISREGARHNALFFLFVPGFLLAALTSEFSLALLSGLPAVLDWAFIHTKIGLKS